MECSLKITNCTNEFWKVNNKFICNACLSQEAQIFLNHGGFPAYKSIEKCF